MFVPDGALMAHVQPSQFYGLLALAAIVPASKAFRLIRTFLGRF
jgi:hypothetical protein